MKPIGIIRAAVLAAALAASAAPAMAAGPHFQFGFGNGFRIHRPFICIEMTDYAIRNAIRARGYSNVTLNVRNDRRIQVRGTKGGWVYLLRVSTCTGAILERQRLRRA